MFEKYKFLHFFDGQGNKFPVTFNAKEVKKLIWQSLLVCNDLPVKEHPFQPFTKEVFKEVFMAQK